MPLFVCPANTHTHEHTTANTKDVELDVEFFISKLLTRSPSFAVLPLRGTSAPRHLLAACCCPSEVMWTAAKKFLLTVPILLFLFAGHAAGWSGSFLLTHLPVSLVVVLAKFPAFHRVRFFGINSSPNILPGRRKEDGGVEGEIIWGFPRVGGDNESSGASSDRSSDSGHSNDGRERTKRT